MFIKLVFEASEFVFPMFACTNDSEQQGTLLIFYLLSIDTLKRWNFNIPTSRMRNKWRRNLFHLKLTFTTNISKQQGTT